MLYCWIKTKRKNGELYFNINGNKSRIEIIKKDEETGEPINGVKFQISSETGEVIGTRVTDENGFARLSGLKQGNYNVEEIETNENYEINKKKYEVKLGYDETYILNITNKHKKGNLIIDKVDKDNNDTRLEGVEFDIIDKSGAKILHIITDSEGKAKATLNTGKYTLRETKTKEEYKIGVDQNIKINWNETLELKIENEKKKGKIKIIKQDKEDKTIKLSGVDFEILNESKECIEKLTTDENGEAISSDLVEGKYFIKEINTQENYILDSEEKEVRVNEDEITGAIIENERIKGKIEIIKTSEDKNKVLKTEEGMPLEGVKFEVYNENNEIVDQIVTDKEGKATTKQLYKGKYKVKEIETNEWYILDENEYDVEIKNNEEIVTLSISNKSKNPMVDITKKCKNLIKLNEELDYTFEISNKGNTDFETFTWYDYLPSEFAKITKIETGTYNQDTTYSIYYKTNLKDEYMVVKKNLKSTENNYINLTDIHMEENEVITEIKVCFDNVKVDFRNKEKPHIFMKLNDNLVNGDNIENRTLLEGTIQGYRTTDEDTTYSTLYNVVEKKKLPRTGY